MMPKQIIVKIAVLLFEYGVCQDSSITIKPNTLTNSFNTGSISMLKSLVLINSHLDNQQIIYEIEQAILTWQTASFLPTPLSLHRWHVSTYNLFDTANSSKPYFAFLDI
jgi:hypothetical protein